MAHGQVEDELALQWYGAVDGRTQKATNLPYNLLSKMSESVISWALESWLIWQLCLLLTEQNETVYHCHIN